LHPPAEADERVASRHENSHLSAVETVGWSLLVAVATWPKPGCEPSHEKESQDLEPSKLGPPAARKRREPEAAPAETVVTSLAQRRNATPRKSLLTSSETLPFSAISVIDSAVPKHRASKLQTEASSCLSDHRAYRSKHCVSSLSRCRSSCSSRNELTEWKSITRT
jgi:hypothetical protein